MPPRPAALRAAAGFAYRAGMLAAEGVPLAQIAADIGTPFYCYASGAIEAQYRRYA